MQDALRVTMFVQTSLERDIDVLNDHSRDARRQSLVTNSKPFITLNLTNLIRFSGSQQ